MTFVDAKILLHDATVIILSLPVISVTNKDRRSSGIPIKCYNFITQFSYLFQYLFHALYPVFNLWYSLHKVHKIN